MEETLSKDVLVWFLFAEISNIKYHKHTIFFYALAFFLLSQVTISIFHPKWQ